MSQHISEDEFQKMLGAIELSHGEKGKAFVEKVEQMKSMLDETDEDDYFGTEGWKRHFGWED